MASDDQTIDLNESTTASASLALRSLLGQRFGPYQLVSVIGAGGAAQVFRARHVHPRQSERSFAVKLPHHTVGEIGAEAAQLRCEAYVLSLLRHPNVVQTFEASVVRGRAFIAMEYVDGRNLGELTHRCQERGIPIPLPVAIYIVGQLLAGLEAAHALRDADGEPLGVTHRDIKPQNVFVSFSGAVKLGDFGLASLTGTTANDEGLRGTAGYLPPEVLAGRPAGRRSDLFSLGAVLFELACGRPLFDGGNLIEKIEASRMAKVPAPSAINPDVSNELEAVILQALCSNPADRYASATDMRLALGPHVPSSPGMRLAVASLMRAAFDAELAEHGASRRTQLARAGRSRVVAVVGRADAAFEDLRVAANGCGVTLERLAAAGEDHAARDDNAACAIVVDLDDSDTSAAVAAAASHAPPLPIVARASALTLAAVDEAYRLSAVDLLVSPIGAARLETALLTTPADDGGRGSSEDPGEEPTGPRTLLVTLDTSLAERLAGPLAETGLRLDIAADLEAAIERLEHTFYHAFICDVAGPETAAEASSCIRGLPGIGAVPILYLTRTGESPDRAPRTAGRPRSDPPAAICAAVMQLVSNSREGRSFKRYPAALPVKLQCAGSWLAGTSINLSRGGLFIACDRLVQLGARVELWLTPSPGSAPIFGWARVVRVELPQDGSAGARLGIELERMLPEDEERFVRLVVDLDDAAEAAGSLASS